MKRILSLVALLALTTQVAHAMSIQPYYPDQMTILPIDDQMTTLPYYGDQMSTMPVGRPLYSKEIPYSQRKVMGRPVASY